MSTNDAQLQEEEMNEENDAREEDIIEDADGDTKIVENNDNDNYRALSDRLNRMETLLERLSGNIEALRDAQGLLVDNGATVREDFTEDMDFSDDSSNVNSELNFLI